MRAQQISNDKKETYNSFVEKNKGSFLQSWGWGEWQKINNREPIRYVVFNDTNQEILSAQLLFHRLAFGQYYLYCPYGPSTKDKNDAAAAFSTLLAMVTKDFKKALFVKIEPQSSIEIPDNRGFSVSHGPRIQPGSTLLLDLQKPEQYLLADMHQKTRYNIKLAAKHEVVVTSGTNLKTPEARTILNLIVNTTARQGYRGHSREYYERLCDFFNARNPKPDMRVQWYAASKHGVILSGGIFVDFAGTRTYLYGGSSDEQKNVMAPYALHWKAIMDAKQNGLLKYDFGGLETTSGVIPGFAKFKTGFGGTPHAYPNPIDVYMSTIKYFAYKIAKQIR